MLLQSAIIILISLVLGIFFQEFVLAKFKKWAKETKWKIDDVVFDSLGNGVIVLAFILLGLWLIVRFSFNLSVGISSILEKTIFVGIIFLVTLWIANFVGDLIKFYLQGGKFPSVSIFSGVVKGVIIITGLTVILQKLNISITPILTTLGVGGLAVALALKDTLSNFFAGLQILISRKIKVGDYIQLSSGEAGYVSDIGWRNTVIKTTTDNLIIIPNDKLVSVIVTNYYLPEKDLWTKIIIDIPYDAKNLERIEKVTKKIAKRIVDNEFGKDYNAPEPKIYYRELGAYSIKLEVKLRLKELRNIRSVQSEFIKELIKEYRRQKIDIAYPKQVVQVEK